MLLLQCFREVAYNTLDTRDFARPDPRPDSDCVDSGQSTTTTTTVFFNNKLTDATTCTIIEIQYIGLLMILELLTSEAVNRPTIQ